jgi:FkbM family methyltransferase
LRNLVQSLLGKKKNNEPYKKSYAQCGEDLIVRFIFDTIGITRPSYMDIGAHHPFYLNNTALLYSLGSRGVNIEPDPVLFAEFTSARPDDINLNVGISDKDGELDFFVMNVPTLNTFSKKEAEGYKDEGEYFIKRVQKTPVLTIDTVLKKLEGRRFPDFLTIDAEGIDELVLKSIDYTTNYPLIICTETISFSNTGRGIKNVDLIEFIKSKGYFLYADTYINSIFLREDKWKS